MNEKNYIPPKPPGLPVQTVNANPVVFVRDDQVFTDSREVAAYFEKRHDHVLRDIDKLMKLTAEVALPNFGEGSALNFEQGFYNLPNTGDQQHRHYLMNREGFELLAMGFTGAKALKWKLSYVKAFKAMESQLRHSGPPALDYSDPQVLIGVMSHLQGQITAKDEVIAGQAQRLVKLNRIEGSVGNLPVTDAAKVLKVKPRFLTKFLQENRWIYKRVGSHHWLAYQRLMPKYLDHRDGHYFNDDGEKHFYTYAVVTPAGIVLLAQMLEDAARSDVEAN